MKISKYYRQLNPVVTEKVNHVERMRAHLREVYLTEAKATASTLFEGVIADCANLSGKKKKF